MNIDQLVADTIRILSMDGVQRANSGHPGMPMGMADIAEVLWTRHLLVDPTDPTWSDRDRFVLSNGHGSMLLYSLLHLSGFPLTMDDLKSFRQWGSVTPGHPERDPVRGIEMTTGPLGQGFGTAVGMAMAEAHLRAVFGPDLIDHHTYVFVGDGDLMEGISSEAASLAGRLGLAKLVCLYDDNHISIEGDTDLAFREDVPGRFAALGWHVAAVDGHDRSAVDEAITVAKADPRPSLIACRTHIAYGAPTKQDSADSHGSPLGEAEIAGAKKAMGWDLPPFEVPAEVYGLFREAMARGTEARRAWEGRRDAWLASDPARASQWAAHWDPPPIDLSDIRFERGSKMATRKASGVVINALASRTPTLIGGSADLAPSTNTMIRDSPGIQDDPAGRNIHFGVREHAMGAAVNGMAVHGGLRPFGATFFVFNDYMRPATRLAALMEAPSIFVYTHDSVFLGEDGPTHQPIEQLASLRAMPGMWVIRPADATETAEAWALAMARTEGPTCIVLTRQDLPVLERSTGGGVMRGGYVLRSGDDAVLVATGSEVALALETAELIGKRGVGLRVVSLPCWEAFFAQDDAYRALVLGEDLPRASLEAAATFGWERVVGGDGLMIGIDRFGASAPAARLAEEFGFTPAAVADRITRWLARR
ncbi:MAG: transketolase [Actinobacteria bacterium RBG_16_68_21]|nr:MAG: transketolase [Actinobacteria bacterium RBG_16_68_21]